MKWDCDMIRDMMPLYQDGICSGRSRQAVEEHAAECAECRKLLKAMGSELETPVREAADALEKKESADEKKRMKRSFQKIQRHWYHRLAEILMLVLILGGSLLLGVNEFRQEGVAFTNLDDIFAAGRFMRFLQKGKYEEAAQMMDFGDSYRSIREGFERGGGEAGRHYRDDFCRIEIEGEQWIIADELMNRLLNFSWVQEQTEDAGEKSALQVLPEDAGSRLLTVKDDGEVLWEGESLWLFLLENHIGGFLIPEDVWEQVTAEHRGDPDFEYERALLRVETKWGTYYAEGTLAEYLLSPEGKHADAYELYIRTWLMPEAIYREAEAKVLRTDREQDQWYEEKYGVVRDMTEEEYGEAMRRIFVASLKEWEEEGGRILSCSYGNAYGYGGSWKIGMNARESDGETERSYELRIYFGEDGIQTIGASWPDSGEEQEGRPNLSRALNVYIFGRL